MGMEDIMKDIDVILVQHANEVVEKVLMPGNKRKVVRQH